MVYLHVYNNSLAHQPLVIFVFYQRVRVRNCVELKGYWVSGKS